MTRDNYAQFWYTGVVLITKPDHYFTGSVNPKTFWGFRNNNKSCDTAHLSEILKFLENRESTVQRNTRTTPNWRN